MQPSYEIQAVARAIEIPERRLEGWIERGVVVPTMPASGTGTRTRFSRQDVLRVAIVAEIQRLFGTNFRPGRIAATIGRDPWHLPLLDTAIGRALQEGSHGNRSLNSRANAKAKLTLCVYQDLSRGLRISATRKPEEILKTAPILLVIDPVNLWRRIQSRLEK